MMPNQNGPAVRDTTDDDGCAGTDANDAASVDDGTATVDDGTDVADETHGAAATVRLTEYAAVRPASTVLCSIRNGITHGGEVLTVRGGRTGSFKQ